MARTADVVVVGAGIVGCSVAYELARAGAKCLLLDRQDVGQEASWASAGVITHPGPGKSPYAKLRRAGHGHFVQFAEELQSQSSIDFEYLKTGTIEPIFTEEEDEEAKGWEKEFHKSGLPMQRMTPAEAIDAEPHIAQDLLAAYFHENDHQIRNPRFMRALAEAATRHGTELLLHQPVRKLLLDGSKVVGVQTEPETIHAGKTIIAAGAWSGELTETVGFSLPVEPVRGQVVLLEGPPSHLRYQVHAQDVFCIPRADGKVLVCATVERNAGFHKRVTADGVRFLLSTGLRIAPGLKDLSMVGSWAGLRPYAARRGGPFIGPVTGLENLLIASGHYRNGVVLGPITGKLLKELLLDGEPSRPLTPFRPDR